MIKQRFLPFLMFLYLTTIGCINNLNACTAFDPFDRFNIVRQELYINIQNNFNEYINEYATEECKQRILISSYEIFNKFINDYEIDVHTARFIYNLNCPHILKLEVQFNKHEQVQYFMWKID